MEIRFLSIIFLIAVSSNLKDISLNFTVDTYFIIKNGVIKNKKLTSVSFLFFRYYRTFRRILQFP